MNGHRKNEQEINDSEIKEFDSVLNMEASRNDQTLETQKTLEAKINTVNSSFTMSVSQKG